MPREVTDEMEEAFVDAAYQPHEQITASVSAGLAAVLSLLDAEDVPAENDDPTKINLIGRTIGRVEIEVDRAEYEMCKEAGILDHLLDARLSGMSEETVVIEPDGTVVNPYA